MKPAEQFEVNEANIKIESPLKISLVIVVFAISIGTSFSVYTRSVVNNLKPIVVPYLNETGDAAFLSTDPNKAWSMVFAVFPVGVATGSIFAPLLAEKIGRKNGVIVSLTVNFAGGIMCLFYIGKFYLVIIGRLFIGFAVGTGIPMASSFVTEIAPLRFRGSCNAGLQTALALGDLSGMLVTLPQLFGSVQLSNWALGFTAFTSVLSLSVLVFAHDSPRHLILKLNQLDAGKKALTFYQGRRHVDDLLNEILSEVKQSSSSDSSGLSRFMHIWKKIPIKQVLVCCAAFVIPIFSGIPLVMGYSSDAFISNGLSLSVAYYSTLSVGVSNLAASILSMHLIEKMGRRTLFIVGLVGSFSGVVIFTVISLIVVYLPVPYGVRYILVAALIVYSVFYSFLNASSLAVAAEVCSQEYRSYCIAFGMFSSMFSAVIMVLTYEYVKRGLGVSFVYLPFNFLSFVLGCFMFVVVPETAGRTLANIKSSFAK